MARVLAAILGLLFTLNGFVGVPVSRIESGRDSSAIVWIAEKQSEPLCVRRPKTSRGPRARFALRSRLTSFLRIHNLFQRPPPFSPVCL